MSEPKSMPSYWALAEEVTHMHGLLDKLQAENTRLRLLVRDIYSSAYYEYPSYFESKFADRMRELGIPEEA